MKDKHLILDMSNILNIAFWRARTVLMEDKTNSKEEIEKTLCNFSITVFLNIFHMYLKDARDHKVYCVYDSKGGTAWRKEVNPDYKANRDHSLTEYHDILYDVIDKMKSILNNYPVYQISVPETEADDLIFSLGSILEGEKKVISSDADLLQLAQKFEDVKVWHPHTKKYRDIPEYDIVMFKAISGDDSDNIFGIPKFGPKRTLKAMEENLACFNEDQKKIIERNLQIVDLSRNPNFKKNTETVKEYLKNHKNQYDFNLVLKSYLDNKQKQHYSSGDSIKKLLDSFNNILIN